MVRKLHAQAIIYEEDAENAIYIDCEGFADKSPALIGILHGDDFEQVVLDPVLSPVAIARGHRISTLPVEANQLVLNSESLSVPIVGFTQHEPRIFSKYANIDLEDHYRDAHKIAKRWRSILYPDHRLSSNGLKDFLDFIEYPVGSYLGYKKTTKRLKDVRDMIKKHTKYDDLTPVAKAKWTKLLQHNEIDCRGMQELVQLASRELDEL